MKKARSLRLFLILLLIVPVTRMLLGVQGAAEVAEIDCVKESK